MAVPQQEGTHSFGQSRFAKSGLDAEQFSAVGQQTCQILGMARERF